ncbi:hypothetical protein LMG18101_00392 [Ralstonia flaminis]|jgi:Tfp pilus assembly protein PilX|uniref:PilX/PilW C-terminal domain-containing protein n=2 Tax=Ralstonia flaminis TaxID=3058597 RepID=A0ABN9JDZ3_9RALS|nr:hypothetical protein LMG18101_00392 [Ralstonia sp. LMG 18101]
MLNGNARAHGFTMTIVVAAAALLGLLTMATFHIVLDQRQRTSLIVDHALAQQAAEQALGAAECELSVATDTPTPSECAVALPQDRIVALNPVTLPGFVIGACGSGITLGLCRPRPDQSLWELAGLLDTTSLGVPIGLPAPTPGSERASARAARYVIEPIPDRWSGQIAQTGEASPPWLYRITAVGFGADPAVYVVLQTVFRPRVSGQTSTPQITIEPARPVSRPNHTVTQTIQTTRWTTSGDQQQVAETQTQTLKLGRLSWLELITEGTR